METHTLAVILARAGSKGLPKKNILPLAGKPMIAYTIEAAQRSNTIDAICVTTDLAEAATIARNMSVMVVDRPPELATDTAPVVAAVRHAVSHYEKTHHPVTHVAILYGNVPARAPDIIDRAVTHLIKTKADSVRSLVRVEKQHPDWLHRLNCDRMEQYRKNTIDRRQDLEKLYYHDGAVVAVARASLFCAQDDNAHSFLGDDRRGVESEGGPTVDIDSVEDLRIAEFLIRGARSEETHRFTEAQTSKLKCRVSSPLAPDVYVIAEAGVNHNGKLADACQLIEAAKDAGADAIKFQLFSADRLVAKSSPLCAYQQNGHGPDIDQHAMLKALELDGSMCTKLKEHADAVGIDFLATPFGLPDLDFLVEQLNVTALKIASPDLVNVPLLTAAAKSGRLLIVSTGASMPEEIDQAVELIKDCGALERLTLLHCVSSYPTALEDARLQCIATLRQRFDVPTGFSDHTVEETTGAFAVMAGAVVLEKHLTMDRRLNGPDHFFSLEPDSFKAYVQDIRRASAIMGDGRLGYAPAEEEVRELARGRIVTTKSIVAGERLTPDSLTVQRPGNGIGPACWKDLIGRVVRVDVPKNTPLDWSMLATLA